MKKPCYHIVLVFVVTFAPSVLIAQVLGLGKRLSQYTAANGLTYHVGDTVKLAQGSATDGSFRYVQYGGWEVFFQSGHSSDAHNVERTFAGYGAVIKKIHTFKAHGIVKAVFAVDIGAGSNFDLWIDQAITSCEVVNCAPAGNQLVGRGHDEDNLDKLKKLKALLDSGAITQEEYNAQKKKLLNQ
jgi:hypothetical protein